MSSKKDHTIDSWTGIIAIIIISVIASSALSPLMDKMSKMLKPAPTQLTPPNERSGVK